MHAARFLSIDEVDLIGSLFESDPSFLRKELSSLEIDNRIKSIKEGVSAGSTKVSMTFDEDNKPYGVHVAYEIPRINGWLFGMTKVVTSSNHYYNTAKAMSSSINLLTSYMENKGYYKFWSHSSEQRHEQRTKIMCKFSDQLRRYEYYDEIVIPKGEICNVALFESFRASVDWTDILIRMFVLKQEHRLALINQKQYSDYIGKI
jgi:hypothetical protein